MIICLFYFTKLTYGEICYTKLYELYNNPLSDVEFFKNSGKNINDLGNYYECNKLPDKKFCTATVNLVNN